jgi:hypothetical protein
MLKPISPMLSTKGMRQPHAMNASCDTLSFTIRKARLARITPTGAPACAKLP